MKPESTRLVKQAEVNIFLHKIKQKRYRLLLLLEKSKNHKASMKSLKEIIRTQNLF